MGQVSPYPRSEPSVGRRPDWQADGRDEIGLRRPGVEDVTVQRRLSSIRSRVPATGR